jgi:hypothetical protein
VPIVAVPQPTRRLAPVPFYLTLCNSDSFHPAETLFEGGASANLLSRNSLSTGEPLRYTFTALYQTCWRRNSRHRPLNHITTALFVRCRNFIVPLPSASAPRFFLGPKHRLACIYLTIDMKSVNTCCFIVNRKSASAVCRGRGGAALALPRTRETTQRAGIAAPVIRHPPDTNRAPGRLCSFGGRDTLRPGKQFAYGPCSGPYRYSRPRT